MTLDLKQLKKVRGSAKGSWKMDIVQYLKSNQGTEEIALVDATHPTGMDRDNVELSKSKKRHNFASQKVYLADEGYIVKKENDKLFLLTEPGKNKGTYTVIPGQEDRVKRLL